VAKTKTTEASKKANRDKKALDYMQTGNKGLLTVSPTARSGVDGFTGAAITKKSATRQFMTRKSDTKKK